MTTNCTPPVGATAKQIRIFADQWHPTELHEPDAKSLCHGCPAMPDCLENALTVPNPGHGGWPTGIFAATTTQERAIMRARREARADDRPNRNRVA